MNVNATSFQSTVRFSEPAAAIDTSLEGGVHQNSQAAALTKRPVENSEATSEPRKFNTSQDRGQNLDIEV
ncbi:hypothetical protein A9Q97_02595 [Rhodospirillales bacterium 47_12_T64]|nr:hypothetical protein A9Q97_02595 [Rhodospirillales bacterium 47_12_T64]